MFFAKITNSYNAKNRLQEYLSKQLKQLECLNVADTDAFKKHLETTVHRANLKFPKCTPLVSYLHPSYTSGDYTAGVGDLIQFSLYAHRGSFEPGQAPAPVTTNEGIQTDIFS